MRRLIWGIAGRTYHIAGNLMSRLICFLLFAKNKGVRLPVGLPKVNQRHWFSLSDSGIQKVEKKLLEVYKNFVNAGANQSTTNSCQKSDNAFFHPTEVK